MREGEHVQEDIRQTPIYRDASSLFELARQPGTGRIFDVAEVNASAKGTDLLFVGLLMPDLSGTGLSRICRINVMSGDVQMVTSGPNTDRQPKYSPEGDRIAFLSDRHKVGDFQLYLLDACDEARPTVRVDGWVEYLHWSPDGSRILLGVAGHGAETSSTQGAVASGRLADDRPSWMPTVHAGDERFHWRRVWIYDLATESAQPVGNGEVNVWEAGWCGNDAIVAVASDGPSEGLWYGARLVVIDTRSGESRALYTPIDQLGCPAASPSGNHVTVVEAVCSDRWLVAGELKIINMVSGKTTNVFTRNTDITYVEWRSNETLLVAGHRGFETVIGIVNAETGMFFETWNSREITTGGRYASVSGIDAFGDCALVGEGFIRAPEIALVSGGEYRAIRSFDLGLAERAKQILSAEPISWKAPDGLRIDGWLLRPNCAGPYPVVMNVHGGPVWQWRPGWLGRGSPLILMLVKRGFAVFLPNPRGSSGRGQDFARKVQGDMGGADTYDLLSGLDFLTEAGVADPARIGVTGGSYGGFMTSWLITHDKRFAAAVPFVPVNNWVTEHLISNIPHWPELFLADNYRNPGGRYFERSPINHAEKVETPTLQICGALDRSAPPGEALQFHNALLANGVKSVLVTYPEEGHGVRKLPAAIDYTARVVSWFIDHMSITD